MRSSVFAALLLWAAAAGAQENNFVGAGVRTRPKVDGASERTTELVPVLRYFGQPWFARTTQGILEGGAQWTVRAGWDVGAELAYKQGPNDENPGATVGVHGEWEGRLGPAPVLGLLRLRQNVQTDRGAQLDLRGNAGVYQGHGFLAVAFGQLTFATQRYYRAYYAVDESGLLFGSLGLQGSYALSRHWMLYATGERRQMSDSAARSPLVVQRAASYISLGLLYNIF